jgi:hypothetical protein
MANAGRSRKADIDDRLAARRILLNLTHRAAEFLARQGRN